MRKALMLAAFLLVVSVPAAMAAKSAISIGLSQGTGDYAGPALGGDYISAFSSPEIGVTAEYWYLFKEDYALAVQGTYGFSSESDKPGSGAEAGALEQKFSTTSYKIRVGGDRVGKIGERFTWFMGPGLEYWSGKAKFENGVGGVSSPTSKSVETEPTKRCGISGRVGGVMKLGSSVGIQGQVGHTLGYASVTDHGAKATWWPSSFNASWGLVFSFGK